MVSSKTLFAMCAISGITHAYPIHQSTEDPSLGVLHNLATRSPSPRFRNPFDANHFLENLDYKIPNNKDIQGWINEAQKKGAMAAKGDFFHDNDDDDDSDKSHDDDKDTDDDHGDHGDDEYKDQDDNDHHNTKTKPKASDKKDDSKDGSKKHNEVKQAAQPAEIVTPSTSNSSTNIDDSAPAETTTVYVPVPVLPTRFPNIPDIDANEGPVTTTLPLFPPPTNTTSTPAAMTSTQDIGSDAQVTDSPAIHQLTGEIVTTTTFSQDTTSAPQATDSLVVQQPTNDIITPTATSSEAQVTDAPMVQQPTSDIITPATTTSPQPTASDSQVPDSPVVQQPVSDITVSATTASPQDATSDPQATDSPVVQVPQPASDSIAPTTTISSQEEVTESPMVQQPVSDMIDPPPTSPSETIQPINNPSPFGQLNHLLDLVSDDDQSDPSYRA